MSQLMPSRFIPDGSVITQTAHGIAYSYERGGRFHAIGYTGKRRKSTYHYSFATAQRRDAHVAEHLAALARSAAHKKARREAAGEAHHFAVGDVVYNSWGYDQTNVDFYLVARATANYVWLQPIGARMVDASGFMSGRVVAEDAEVDLNKPMEKHRAHANGRISFNHGGGGKWEGRPLYMSWYA